MANEEGFPDLSNMNNSQEIYLFLDPGKTIGWAIFLSTGIIVDFDQVTELDKLIPFLTMLLEPTGPKLKRVVFENYRIRPIDPRRKSQLSKHEREGHAVALKCVGKIEAFCDLMKIPRETQEPTMKTPGYAYLLAATGIKPASNHAHSHKLDALAHGMFYMVKHGIREIKARRIPIVGEDK